MTSPSRARRIDIDTIERTLLHYVRNGTPTAICGVAGRFTTSGGTSSSASPTICPLCALIHSQMKP